MEIIDLNEDNDQETVRETSAKKNEKERQPEEKFSWKRELLSWVLTFAIAIATAILLKNYVIINANVPSGSMENTIMPGDDLLGFRLSYLFSEPERGDIVIFKFPDDESQNFIKRVIGLPGEKVVIDDGKIYINDSKTPLDESYLKEEWVIGTGYYEFNVPLGCYLVMGDNRNDSNDARYWENTYVTKEEIIGKAEFIYYPFSHIKSLR
jgi:signal peptidase I